MTRAHFKEHFSHSGLRTQNMPGANCGVTQILIMPLTNKEMIVPINPPPMVLSPFQPPPASRDRKTDKHVRTLEACACSLSPNRHPSTTVALQGKPL